MSYFHLSETCSFDQIIQFPQSRILGKTLNIVEEVLLLCFKQLPVICDQKWLSPKWADVHSDHLRGVDDLPQWPHEGTIHPHQLLGADLVSFVQNHTHLVLMVFQRLDHLWELIRNVQLVGVEQQDDSVHSFCKPLKNCCKVIACNWEMLERRALDWALNQSSGKRKSAGLQATCFILEKEVRDNGFD